MQDDDAVSDQEDHDLDHSDQVFDLGDDIFHFATNTQIKVYYNLL
ncbi:MAG: hypothetical protein Q8877_03525 [Sweet potato little leaf phytoplasma]|nr:hypothetical protein [Sweet potato little leaf phytoplasma]